LGLLNNHFLAVYGTLKQGYYNYNKYLKEFKPVYTGFIEVKFQLHSNGRYPMIIHSPETNNIYFEIFEISTRKFEEIIELEEPYGYHYETIEIPNLNQRVEVFVYTAGGPPSEFNIVENGIWEPTIPW
jgi:gamma-glutamylcyclotransferase (GGCT)/AIG2-like uncharacterized protein YtfP